MLLVARVRPSIGAVAAGWNCLLFAFARCGSVRRVDASRDDHARSSCFKILYEVGLLREVVSYRFSSPVTRSAAPRQPYPGETGTFGFFDRSAMPNLDLILTLTAGLAVALVFGFLAVRFKLPSIIGYLLAGLL